MYVCPFGSEPQSMYRSFSGSYIMKNRDHIEAQKTKDGSLPEPLRVVHPDAAGIDIGSRKHYVAVPPDRDREPVRSFGCLTPDLHSMAQWLKRCGIMTAAVESTAVYWIPVMQVLEEYGLEVYLVDAREAKNMPGRKTDVKDCQWLQQLHAHGMLTRAFRPADAVCVLRSYWRHRKGLVEMASMQIQLMQKSLEQMNLQLHKVLSDITGVTGMYQQKILDCDREIEAYMKTLESHGDPKSPPPRPTGKRRKNQVHFDLRKQLYTWTGVDITVLPDINAMTAQTVLSESGNDMSRFATEKHYSSWLGLSPNHQITGGRVRKRRTRKVRNRAAAALRVAAQSLHKSKTALGAYYRRMRARLGPAKAITATAHKLAILIYRMLKYGMDYVEQGQKAYEKQYQQRKIQMFVKHAKQIDYNIVDPTSGEIVS